ncbi:hypothetical protein BV25DRAFT_1837464 [Artomyces pyxidatus]|uniref:Uncharacterized protein n=1 Tax=Artomyces pyxidatus TaxID=48021 RepID=A0ACB8T7J8_9AGAM|nr:hypothetical protein BV25DRAFT_1837464 [Artomyces pyxidatus]
MTTTILRLPDDVFLELLERANYRDILACQATCRRLNKMVTESASLQYKIELAACGMLDGPRNERTAGVAERLRRLRLYDAAWRQLKWTAKVSLPHLAGYSFLELEAGGAFLSRPLFQQIPSHLRGIEEHHRTICKSIGSKSLVDSSQDVFATLRRTSLGSNLLECRLHSLSTGQVHTLSSGIDPCDHTSSRSISEILGDFILEEVLNPTSFTTDHIVWNWKTGHIVMIANTPPRVRIFRFTSTGSYSDSGPGVHADILSYSFLLPEDVRPTASMVSKISRVGHASLSRLGHFHHDPNGRLLVLSATIVSRGERIYIDIPITTFQSYVAKNPPSSGHTDMIVPWDAWGPASSRMSRMPSDVFIDDTITNGMRKLAIQRSMDGGVTTLIVTDYHPRRVARALVRQQRDGGDEGTVILCGDESMGAGLEHLQTTLPCTVKEIPFPTELESTLLADGVAHEIHLCDDGLLFLKYKDVGGCITNAWAYTF